MHTTRACVCSQHSKCMRFPPSTNPPVSGCGFSYDDLYVAASLDLPEGECACQWLLCGLHTSVSAV